MTGMECSRLYDLAPELALGLLDGAERAEALAHLERCAKCHADVASLTELGEQLLLLAPEGSPPAGFESRVLQQLEQQRPTAEPPDEAAPAALRSATTTIAPPAPGRRRRRYRFHRTLLAAAAALVVLVGSAVVLVAGAGDGDGGRGGESAATTTAAPEPEPEVMASAPMMSGRGTPIGTIELLDTTPTTVRLDMAGWMDAIEQWPDPPEGPWTIDVFDATGRHESYDLPLPTDDATPDVTLDADLGPVHHVSVLDGTGRIWCTGRFT
jgi:hypothetical protein